MRELSHQDLKDILNGAVILGAGGGGDLAQGLDLIQTALDAGKSFRMVSIDEVPDNAVICTPYMIGAVSALSPEQERQYSRLPRGQRHPILVAYEEFQKYLGVKFYGTTACELGGSNTAMAFFPAVMSDHYILDADPAGRAVPEITHSTYYLAGLPAAPIYTANEFGETFVLEGVCDDQRAETIVRALSQVSRNDLAAIDHALPMRELRNALIPGTISKALEIGKIWRETLEVDGDAISEVTRLSGGLEVFQGRVSLADYETIEGFTKGFLVIDGLGKFSGQSMQVSVKNENMACWINGQVFATVPDLICMFGAETQKPVANPDCQVGQSVKIVLLPAPEVFRTAKGLEAFGPRYAGLSTPYAWPGETRKI